MTSKRTRIGIYHLENRNWHRNITCHEHDQFEFRVFRDYYRATNAILKRIGRMNKMYKFARRPPSWPHVDLYHHFRMLDFGSTPWVVSTSSGLPYGWPRSRQREAFELLASESCKRIIVTGQCAYDWQIRKLEREPDLLEIVSDKMEQLPPCQPVLLSGSDVDMPERGSTLRLAFVGASFFRKGGLELVRVVERLAKRGADIHLDVVSSMTLSDQTRDTVDNLKEARSIIARCRAITHHGRLPNESVLGIFKKAHLGLLPSYVETYGYTVLEAQACGCPTITTDIFAFPEINPDTVGWRARIDGPDYDFRSDAGLRVISEKLESELERILEYILENPSELETRSAAAVARISSEHDPSSHAERLTAIYRSALSS